jgi:hypothetical protein
LSLGFCFPDIDISYLVTKVAGSPATVQTYATSADPELLNNTCPTSKYPSVGAEGTEFF